MEVETIEVDDGWRASRWSGGEDGGESDTSEASGRSLGRRHQYSRGPSRELHNIPDEELTGPRGMYAGSGGGMSLPRPYPVGSGGGLNRGPQQQDSADRIAAMYGTLRGPLRRPHSTVVGQPGECIGRDGGHCEQQTQHCVAASHDAKKNKQASTLSPGAQQQTEETEALKQSVQEQLQQLVRELEAGEDTLPPLTTPQPVQGQGSPMKHSNKPQYASNPVLSMTCISPQPPDNQGVQSGDNVSTIHRNTAVNNHNNRTFQTNLPSSNSVTHRSLLDINKDGSGSESSGSIRRPYSSTDWQRPGSTIIRSADSSALEAYRRTHGRGSGVDLHRYQRGKSEDLRHALDSLSGKDSTKTKSVTSLMNNKKEDFPRSNLKVPDSRRLVGSAQDLTGMMNVMNNHTYENINGNGDTVSPLKSNMNLINNNPEPTPTTMSPTNEPNNNNGITSSRSSCGIPVKSSSSGVKGVHISQSGNSINTNTNTTSTKPDLLQPKVYHKSKSRELTPAIEAASEKFGQFSSGTLKRISPFEAYRRTKSRELPLDQTNINRNSTNVRLNSPPPAMSQAGFERAKSPFEKAKISIEKKFETAKSPDKTGSCDVLPGSINSPQSPTGEQHKNDQIGNNAVKDKGERTKENVPNADMIKNENKMVKTKENEIEKAQQKQVVVKTNDKEPEKGQERGGGAGSKEEDNEKEKTKVKKTVSCDPEKPKSMYKLLASRFNRSNSNMSESNRTAEKRNQDEEEGTDKDDKTRLKRHSRFLKHRTEKSSSKSSLCDPEGNQEDSERADRKPSKKLTDALNKFLGRKESKEDHKGSNTSLSKSSSTAVKGHTEEDMPKKPPRFRAKIFSKSHENLALSHNDDMIEVCDNGLIPSVKPNATTSTITTTTTTTTTTTGTHKANYTLESVTKSICNHLSQLENDISSRIGSMGVSGGGSGSGSGGGGECQVVPAVTTVCSITTYGLSPALASRRNGKPTNLDVAAANKTDSNTTNTTAAPVITALGNTVPKTSVTTATKTAVTKTITSNNTPKPTPTTNNISPAGMKSHSVIPNKEVNVNSNGSKAGDERDIKFAQIKKLPSREARESSEYSTENEDTRGLSEGEDESVIDRITRKSFYSKFQDKKKPKLRRANTKEDMDQQLAAAKARLMKEDTERALRDSFSPNRLSSSPATSPRSSLVSPQGWEPIRRPSRKSLPPDDAMAVGMYSLGGRRGTSLQPDHLQGLNPEDSMKGTHHLPSPDGHYHMRAPSVPVDPYQRVMSPPRDTLQYRRSTSLVREELSPSISGPGNLGASSPNTKNQDDVHAQNPMAVAAAAGALAGEVAAGVAANTTSIRSREPSLTRLRSPEPSRQDDTRTQAREELSRRLTHLTRISGTSGLVKGTPGGVRGAESEQRPYRRTQTTGRLAGEVGPSSGVPAYRRTNTMDLPPADARARPGSEYRRHLTHDPTRRCSARTLVEGVTLPTSPSHTPSRLPTSRLTSPPSTLYRAGGSTYNPMDSTRFNTISSLPRRSSFYRY
ncbi:hypothetical protein Pcinc_031303 [Petrolisthes cinctipes]|uniref:Uncharacterized protein n=1 Tax=Petrolisthes cinctipes TaxID=88211 RepID=A0AAE1EXE9_PETCI|nr:hypothetical protein Pcinc_031303 [Petrolisthes cinctipes]